MFLVFNKEKIQTYFVSILTVGVLIIIANMSTAQILPTSSSERALNSGTGFSIDIDSFD